MKKFKELCSLVLSVSMLVAVTSCSTSEEDTTETVETLPTVIVHYDETEPASAEVVTNETATEWICESCGATGNTGRFCNECGAMAPESFRDDGYVNVSENTSPSVTAMTYETEESVGEGANEDTFGTMNPIPITDLNTGLELDIRFYGTISYDGEFEDQVTPLAAYVVDSAYARFYNMSQLYPYSEFPEHMDDLELGIASDIRDELGFTNVTITIESLYLTEDSQEAYDEYARNSN